MEAEFSAGCSLTSSLDLLPLFSASQLEETARMASLTSSSWIVDMAKCFGWIGDRDDYLTSFSQYPSSMLLFPLGEQNMGDLLPNAAPPTQALQSWMRRMGLSTSCCSWRGSLPRSLPWISHLSHLSFAELVRMVMNGWRRRASHFPPPPSHEPSFCS